MKDTLILRAAAIYNAGYGLLLAFYPARAFRFFGMPETPDVIIQCIGMMVGVYGLAYWIAGSDPNEILAVGGCRNCWQDIGPYWLRCGPASWSVPPAGTDDDRAE